MIATIEKKEVIAHKEKPSQKGRSKKVQQVLKPSKFDLSNVTVSIDTLWIVCRLSKKEREELKNNFLFINSPEKYHYNQVHFNKDLGISIMMNPARHSSHYNVCVKMQNKLFSKPLPASVKNMIDDHEWMIRQIDIAYDTNIPMKKSLSICHNANIKPEKNPAYTNTKYVGKLDSRSRSKSKHYNRDVKEKERNNSDVKHPQFNRYEVKLTPSLGENDKIMLHSMTQQDHDKIIHFLDKYKYIPDISKVQATKEEKAMLIKLSDDFSFKKELTRTQWNKLDAIIKANRLPLSDLYTTHKDKMFEHLMR